MGKLWEAEEFWTGLHCVSTLLDKVSKKRKGSKRQEPFVVGNDEVLSLVSSKQDNSKNFLKLIEMKHFKRMAEIMMDDIYRFKFDDCSSVDNKSNISLNEKLDLLMSISLLQHSFGVVNELYKIITKRYGIYSDVFYITALAHDFGKCPDLRKAYKIDSTLQHHKASAEYIKSIAIKSANDVIFSKQDNELVNVICDVLNAHHTPEDENMFFAAHANEESKTMQILVLEKLKYADTNQREIELGLFT